MKETQLIERERGALAELPEELRKAVETTVWARPDVTDYETAFPHIMDAVEQFKPAAAELMRKTRGDAGQAVAEPAFVTNAGDTPRVKQSAITQGHTVLNRVVALLNSNVRPGARGAETLTYFVGDMAITDDAVTLSFKAMDPNLNEAVVTMARKVPKTTLETMDVPLVYATDMAKELVGQFEKALR